VFALRIDSVCSGDSPAVCSSNIPCDHGHVESLCGKSFAHSRCFQFMASAKRNAVQSSWNVT
jgi:hypothetical protein